MWDAATGAPVGGLLLHRASVNSASFSLDGTRVVTASDDKPRARRESEVGMEGLAPRVRIGCGSPLWRQARNPLKSPESDEGIQFNPRESKPVFLGFSWPDLDLLGKIWPETRAAVTSA